MEERGNYSYHWPRSPPLHSACTELEIENVARVEGEASGKDCKITDVAASFKSDVRKQYLDILY